MVVLAASLLLVATGFQDPDAGWIDASLARARAAAGLEAAPLADPATRIRRLHLVLTGLPPTPDEVRSFVEDPSPSAWAGRVDALLGSTACAERFARHWMDWFRYAETHGSEGDPAVPHAWRYRDYLIRALREDVPYDQLVREHIAGDLLPAPRVDAELGVVESRLGVVQLRMVQHGFAPTDALEEKVRFVDNQIDVLTKGFLGLTVSCARCHDHKFDPITQDEYQALYACLASARPVLQTVDVDADLTAQDAELERLHAVIRSGLVAAWGSLSAEDFERRLMAAVAGTAPAATSPLRLLHDAVRGADVADVFSAARREVEAGRRRIAERGPRADLDAWARSVPGASLCGPGGFHVLPDGERVLADVLPSGLYSHLLTSKRAAVASSPTFRFDDPAVRVRVTGDGEAMVRYVVEGYPRGGTVYPLHRLGGGGAPSWVGWDVGYWEGDHGYVEASTAADQAVEVRSGRERSWFGITDVYRGAADRAPRDELCEHASPLFDAAGEPVDVGGLVVRYAVALRMTVARFGDGSLDDDGARFLGALVRAGVLPSTLDELPALRDAVSAYRAVEALVPVPRRAPGLLDVDVTPQPRMVRGNHRDLGPPVEPAFLHAVRAESYPADASVRLRLAADFARADNPWTARVLVNRLWHHVFGRGIVATPDNFGSLGDAPAHPELLDALAADFVASGWSIRHVLRSLCTSHAFQQDSGAMPAALERDPDNRLLSRFGARRLEAEAIRDAMLAVSGRLDATPFGPPVDGSAPRRSVYVRVRRNDLDSLLRTFDFPEPHTTRGRRDVTNVPAQALALSNDPFVVTTAAAFADRARSEEDRPEAIARVMIERAFGRPASDVEVRSAVALVAALADDAAEVRARFDAIDERIAARERAIATLRAPIRARLEEERRAVGAESLAPAPFFGVRFDGDAAVVEGGGSLVLRGSARMADGALVLDGDGHAEIAGLHAQLGPKTLAALVVVDDLARRGGAVVSVESADGGVFDAVVLGERVVGHWVPGSDHFRRTEDLDGQPESAGSSVHVAICYDADGTIRAYRNGEPYGRSYRSNGPVRFEAEDARVLLGLRHSPSAAGKLFRGRILEATVHDRALTAEEVRVLASASPWSPSDAEVDAALSAEDRAALSSLVAGLDALRAERFAIGGAGVDEARTWTDRDGWRAVAQSLFASQEFLFLR
ncbi:MAG: DUF1553 domain-containing protein [Planctomycetota bacterium]|nr:DUF1553 domain-containing protein [Planctomycetota bacterium]